MEALRVENLTKNFGGVAAVQNLSFKVNVGEQVAIIGPNGAGKSTLLNLLSGQLLPTKGHIYFHDKDVSRLSVHKRVHLGFARSFQMNSLCPNLTVFDNMMLSIFGTKNSRFGFFKSVETYKEYKEHAQYLLQNMDLLENQHKLVKDIGYGEQRKLEISLSIASGYEILLLDEPTAGLTNVESEEIIRIISNMTKDKTLLIVTHDIDSILSIINRTIVLNFGEMVIDGETDLVTRDKKVKEIYMGEGGI